MLAASPLFVPERRGLDDAIRDAAPLPKAFVAPVGSAVLAALRRRGAPPVLDPDPLPDPVAVRPGSLGLTP
jgi:hypothetical protein